MQYLGTDSPAPLTKCSIFLPWSNVCVGALLQWLVLAGATNQREYLPAWRGVRQG
jgi:hypothetical protein